MRRRHALTRWPTRTCEGSAQNASIVLPAAVGITWLMQSLLFGVTPVDPAAYGVAAAALAAIALAACALPAWRAMRVDPLVALRDE